MRVSKTDRQRPVHTLSPGVRPSVLDVEGLSLSGLLSEPPDQSPRATVVALHGGGMRAGYFDGQAHPDLSMLTLGAGLGFTVLALDRPGYGESAAQVPEGLTLDEQAAVVAGVLDAFAKQHAVGKGFLLLAHSFGGKLALVTAAHTRGLLGLDASGVGHRYNIESADRTLFSRRMDWERNWGPVGLYPPGTFRAAEAVVAPIPVREAAEIAVWPGKFDELAPRIDVPMRLTFAEHEAWWLHADRDLADLTGRLTGAPVVRVERQFDAGHNISLGRVARSYHLRAFAFFEECLQSAPDTVVRPTRKQPD
ncbi:alpha/beta fold hydrolase [Mycobacteroides abscessus]|uniref:alpha/beta fold hydrolase n=1 Tax=Mycobacteroides abscessus TaxID=36809 RepID=UPI001F26FF75|nr:alpha/beta hydrolase [Mycobacteroides abscessus]